MSFSIYSTGKLADVRADVIKQAADPEYIHPALTDAILIFIDALLENSEHMAPDSVRIECAGHRGTEYQSSLNLTITPFRAAPAAAVAPTISNEALEFEAGRNIVLVGRPLPDAASDSAKLGYSSVTPSPAADFSSPGEAPASEAS
jgi:hypothetical protein